ncbi:MAG: hypothetical protein GY953_20205 [bacterium]|nr:hypothetical protein [bacterium]
MKTAVSLPDEVFELAEATAKRLRVSRSRLYATAIAEYLERTQSARVTERLNRVYLANSSELGSALHRAQVASLDEESS